MSPEELTTVIAAAVALAGALTAYLKSRTAVSKAATANKRMDIHLLSEHPVNVTQTTFPPTTPVTPESTQESTE
jgi:hypothetical protein